MTMLPRNAHRVLEKPLYPKLHDLPPKQPRKSGPLVVAPPEGWEAHSLYLCHVSVKNGNPIHESYLSVGFLEKSAPAGYTEIWNNSYERVLHLSEVVYLRCITKLHTKGSI